MKWESARGIIKNECKKALKALEDQKTALIEGAEQKAIKEFGLKVRFDYLKKMTGMDYPLVYEKDSYVHLSISDTFEHSGLLEKAENFKALVESTMIKLDGCESSVNAELVVARFRRDLDEITASHPEEYPQQVA